MRIPDPKANTTTEAYLAYKAGYLEESELKPVLYEPYLHFDAWLAYWCGLTNTYPTDENGNPEMLCDEEALVAYLSGITDTYPEEIKDPYDVRITGYLRYLCSYRFGRPEYPVTNSEFYLSLLDAPHTSNETPSADIELDTSKGKLIDVKAYGDTYQQTYSGKNLIDYITNKSEDGSGITITLGSDGIFTVTGVLTTNYKKIVNIFSIDNVLEDGATYTVSKTIDSTLLMPQIIIYNKNTGTYSTINVVNTTSANFEVNKSAYSYQFSAQTFTTSVWGEESRTVKMGFMLEKSATATAFEPYVGGIPSPSPDYPQDIQVVTGEQSILVRGKNMFDKTTAVQGALNGNGSVDGSDRWYTSDFIRVMPNTTYYKNDSFSARFKYYDKDKNRLSDVYDDIPDAGSSQSFTTPSNAYWIRLSVYDTRLDTLQIEKGDEGTDYQPYSSQTYTIDLGSIELCKIGDYQDYIYKNGDDWYIHKTTGKKTFSSSQRWITASVGTEYVFYNTTITDYAISKNIPISDFFTGSTNVSSYGSVPKDCIAFINQSGSTTPRFYVRYRQFHNEDELRAFLGDNTPTVYYALETASDTKITDDALIGQLEALLDADTYDEKTCIMITPAGSNLPALLKVEAYKY